MAAVMSRAYSVRIHWQDGRTTIPYETDNSVLATAYARNNVAHDPRVIRRVEVHDPSGCLETVWAAGWSLQVGSEIRITVGTRSITGKVLRIYSTDPWDLEYEITNPQPGRGPIGRWKQSVDGGTIDEL